MTLPTYKKGDLVMYANGDANHLGIVLETWLPLVELPLGGAVEVYWQTSKRKSSVYARTLRLVENDD